MGTMGTITADEIRTDEVHGGSASGFITIGSAKFPSSDSAPRSVASFGDANAASFTNKSSYQSVLSASATIDPWTTIVGVNFDGPVDLFFPEAASLLANEISVVDEGGFCSSVNSITAISSGALGSLTLSAPYSHLNIKTTTGSFLFSEVRRAPLVPGTTVNEDGSQVVVDESGNSVTTSTDGNTTSTILVDGTTVEAVTSGNTTTSVTVSPDGTVEETTVSSNGASESFTTLPDGTTVEAEASTSGNTTTVTVSPTGEVTTQGTKTNGSSTESVVNPDGSALETVVAANGRITITEIKDGVEIISKYVPSRTTFTVQTTPPGTTTTESPNPYYTG